MHNKELIELLTKEYTLILASTPEDFQAVKTVREAVFPLKYNMPSKTLEEKGFLFSQDDAQSFLYLLRHTPSNTYVGTVRVFFVNHKTPIHLLPMQKDGGVKDIGQLTQTLPIVEISRAALIQNLPYHKKYSIRQLHALLTYRLRIATRINFLLYPNTMVFSLMKPALHHILKRQHVNFKQIGEPVDSYGMHTPFGIERKALLSDTEETMGTITRHYLKALCQNPDAFWRFIDHNPYLERSDIQLERICQLFKEYGDDVPLSLLIGEEL